MTTVAVLGAGGTMGLPMARNLAEAGVGVRAWNRSREKAEPLAEHGVAVVDEPAEAVEGADVVLTILADADAVLETMEAAAGSVTEDAVWLQMSTIGEQGTERCKDFAQEHGLDLIDAPVLGTKQPAEEGKLVVLASGDPENRPRLEPLLDAVGQRTLWVDDEPGAGTRLKLVVNSWVLAVVEAGAETIALAEGLGLDPKLFFDSIDGGPLDLPYLRNKGQAMTERDFTPAFKLGLAAKDAQLVEDAADHHGLDLPLVAAVRARLAEGAEEHGAKDMAATYLTSAPD